MALISITDKVKFKNYKDAPKFAKVIDNSDPKGIGRIKVELPGMYDPTDTTGSNLPWIRRMRTTMGIGVEEINIPAIGDAVELYWPYDNKHAFYRGIPAGDASNLAVFEQEYDWGWGFKSGLKICVNKETGTFLLKNNGYYISNDAEGVITIETDKSINTTSQEQTNITSTQNLTIICKANTKIKTTGDTNITSTGDTSVSGNNMTITGNLVKIGSNTTIDGVTFLDHTHTVDGDETGGVIVSSS